MIPPYVKMLTHTHTHTQRKRETHTDTHMKRLKSDQPHNVNTPDNSPITQKQSYHIQDNNKILK